MYPHFDENDDPDSAFVNAELYSSAGDSQNVEHWSYSVSRFERLRLDIGWKLLPVRRAAVVAWHRIISICRGHGGGLDDIPF